MIWWEYMEEIQSRFDRVKSRHAGGGIKRWLADHYGTCSDLVFTLADRGVRRTFRTMDVHRCCAVYALRVPVESIRAVIESKPDFRRDEVEGSNEEVSEQECFAWLRRGESKKLEDLMPGIMRSRDERDGVGTVGHVYLTPTHMRVEAFSKKKYAFAKRMVKKYFGASLRLEGESVVDLAKQALGSDDRRLPLAAPEPVRGHSLSLEEERRFMEDFYRRTYERFLDDTIPMLGGMTPRHAARDPAMRPRLLELMKYHLHGLDDMDKSRGVKVDIGWVLKELGLGELL